MKKPRFSVIIIHTDGLREVRASNVTLEIAQAVQTGLAYLFPQARIVIEPPPDGPAVAAGETQRPGTDDTHYG